MTVASPARLNPRDMGSPNHSGSQVSLSTAVNSEVTSARALQQVILDEINERDAWLMFGGGSRRRRRCSTLSTDHLLMKHMGPTLSSKLLNATTRELRKVSSSQLKAFAEIDSEKDEAEKSSEAVKRWIASSKLAVQSIQSMRNLKRGSGLMPAVVKLPPDPSPPPSSPPTFPQRDQGSLFLALLAGKRFKSGIDRSRTMEEPLKKSRKKKKSTRSTQPQERRGDQMPLPSLEKVQLHIARVKVLVGQGGSTSTRYLEAAARHEEEQNIQSRASTPRRGTSVELGYKSPFPVLKKKRHPVMKPREEMLYSQIVTKR